MDAGLASFLYSPEAPSSISGPSYVLGTVTATGPLRVRLDGDTSATPVTPLALAAVDEGDRVVLVMDGHRMILLGRVGGDVPEPIPYGADLNDYLKTGIYLQGWNANIPAGGGNYPDGRAGILEVFNNLTGPFTLGTYSHIAQRFTTYVGDVWQRHHYNGWKPWRPVNVDSGWQTPALINSWANYGGQYPTIQYRRLNGVTYLKGLGRYGTSGGMFTLPAGYRPLERNMFTVMVNNSSGYVPARLDVHATGVVELNWGYSGANFVTLSGVAFPADQ